MKKLKVAQALFSPVLITGLVIKGLVVGIGIPESLAIGFLSALYGVEAFFYLKRLHKVEQRQLNKVVAEMQELKSHLSALKVQQSRTIFQAAPIGNVAWGQNNQNK